MNYLVTTTINIPTLLKDYIKDFQQHEHEFMIIVAGDLKTPKLAKDYCNALPNTVYLSPQDQKKLFSEIALYRHIPFNSIDRRNFAYLYCLSLGLEPSDSVITIDDDNYIHEHDFLGKHNASTYTGPVKSSNVPVWINPLDSFYSEEIFMRGCSPFARTQRDKINVTEANLTIPIAVNQGLWNGSPDIDAITRLSGQKEDMTVTTTKPMVLGRNIMAPFDTQNTAYLNSFGLTAFLPAHVGRHDDIFSSYVTKKIADHLRYGVRYGDPVVYQDRNDHDNYEDFLLELHGMSTCDTLNTFLQNIDLKSTNMLDAFAEIADQLKENFPMPNLNRHLSNKTTHLWSIGQIAQGMNMWLDALSSQKVSINQSSETHALHHAA